LEGKVVSKREINRNYRYKGKAPFRSDRIIAWWSKLLFQLLIYSIIYTIFIPGVRAKYNNFFIEFLFVFFWLISSDILAYAFANLIKMAFNYYKGYFSTEKKRGKNYNRKGIEYLLYTSIRCLSYVSGLTPLLTAFLYSLMPFLWGFFAYLLVWLLIFIASKGLAKALSIWITKTI